MKKGFKTILTKIILGVSLGVTTATTAIPTTTAFAFTYSQSNLSMQTIYRQDGFVIAQVNASPDALSKGIYMICEGVTTDDYKI